MSVRFEVHKKNASEDDEKTFPVIFEFTLETRMIDVRDEIMWKLYDSCKEREEHDMNYLEIENISPKLYKDFGKLFFDLGLLPKTIDNYPLSKFTNEERTYQFRVERVRKEGLKDYVPVKRFYELSEEEKRAFAKKPVSKKEDKKVVVEEEVYPTYTKMPELTEEDMAEMRSLYHPTLKKKYDDW